MLADLPQDTENVVLQPRINEGNTSGFIGKGDRCDSPVQVHMQMQRGQKWSGRAGEDVRSGIIGTESTSVNDVSKVLVGDGTPMAINTMAFQDAFITEDHRVTIPTSSNAEDIDADKENRLSETSSLHSGVSSTTDVFPSTLIPLVAATSQSERTMDPEPPENKTHGPIAVNYELLTAEALGDGNELTRMDCDAPITGETLPHTSEEVSLIDFDALLCETERSPLQDSKSITSFEKTTPADGEASPPEINLPSLGSSRIDLRGLGLGQPGGVAFSQSDAPSNANSKDAEIPIIRQVEDVVSKSTVPKAIDKPSFLDSHGANAAKEQRAVVGASPVAKADMAEFTSEEPFSTSLTVEDCLLVDDPVISSLQSEFTVATGQTGVESVPTTESRSSGIAPKGLHVEMQSVDDNEEAMLTDRELPSSEGSAENLTISKSVPLSANKSASFSLETTEPEDLPVEEAANRGDDESEGSSSKSFLSTAVTEDVECSKDFQASDSISRQGPMASDDEENKDIADSDHLSASHEIDSGSTIELSPELLPRSQVAEYTGPFVAQSSELETNPDKSLDSSLGRIDGELPKSIGVETDSASTHPFDLVDDVQIKSHFHATEHVEVSFLDTIQHVPEVVEPSPGDMVSSVEEENTVAHIMSASEDIHGAPFVVANSFTMDEDKYGGHQEIAADHDDVLPKTLQVATTSTPFSAVQDESKRPTSHWTPSYFVTQMGGDSDEERVRDSAELDKLDQLPTRTIDNQTEFSEFHTTNAIQDFSQNNDIILAAGSLSEVPACIAPAAPPRPQSDHDLEVLGTSVELTSEPSTPGFDSSISALLVSEPSNVAIAEMAADSSLIHQPAPAAPSASGTATTACDSNTVVAEENDFSVPLVPEVSSVLRASPSPKSVSYCRDVLAAPTGGLMAPPTVSVESRAIVQGSHDGSLSSGAGAAADVAPVQEMPDDLQTFPTAINDMTTTLPETRITPVPLPSVDEYIFKNSTSAPLEARSPKEIRTRLESTTSIASRFNGGRFSTSPKVPQEGRASLDIAAGEFIPVRRSSTSEYSPVVPSVSSVLLKTPVNGDEEKRTKWCSIM